MIAGRVVFFRSKFIIDDDAVAVVVIPGMLLLVVCQAAFCEVWFRIGFGTLRLRLADCGASRMGECTLRHTIHINTLSRSRSRRDPNPGLTQREGRSVTSMGQEPAVVCERPDGPPG